MKNLFSILILAILLSGCTTVQTISKLDKGTVNLVCIVKNNDVGKDVLESIQDGLTNHGVKYRVIPGSYVKKDNLWIPTVQDDSVAGCDANLFYVANWTWDIVMYMHFANIWMTTPDLSKRLGSATYDSRASMNKYTNAHTKILELIDGLFEQYKNVSQAAPTQADVTNNPTSANAKSTVTNSTSEKLRELQTLRNDGVITEADYQKKKKQLLEQF